MKEKKQKLYMAPVVKTVDFVVEGGFADSEVKSLEEAGAKIVSLGHRILRTETAGMTVMTILSFLLDE